MSRTTMALFGAALALSTAVYACSSATNSALGADGTTGPRDGDAGGFAPAPAGADRTPVDNAVILVHAAKSQAFRLCFSNEQDRRPQPDSQVMPDANVVGVEVGSAVRIGPLRGAPGDVFLFDEPNIRPVYPLFGGSGAGPTCANLLASSNPLSAYAVKVATIDTDLAHGVHLLVLTGCPRNGPVVKYSTQECGESWTIGEGNLAVKEITLPGALRTSQGILPAQVVNLSQPLESARGGRDVSVTFGDLTTPDASMQPVVTNPLLFAGGEPSQPAQLSYPSTDSAIYASVGFRVEYTDGVGKGAPVLDESLERIQRLSSPRDVPPSYYATASNYALLLLGDPSAKLADGGPDDDDLRNIHFLAVPVIDADGGSVSDAGSANGGGANDGGAAP